MTLAPANTILNPLQPLSFSVVSLDLIAATGSVCDHDQVGIKIFDPHDPVAMRVTSL